MSIKQHSSASKLFDVIESMAWDLTHLKYTIQTATQEMSLNPRLIKLAHLATFDRSLCELINLAPLKAIAFSKEGYFLPMLQTKACKKLDTIASEIDFHATSYEETIKPRNDIFENIETLVREKKERIELLQDK